jgi:hypothetical protein
MITALSDISGYRNRRFSSVVLPLPRKPVITETGIRVADLQEPVGDGNLLHCFLMLVKLARRIYRVDSGYYCVAWWIITCIGGAPFAGRR